MRGAVGFTSLGADWSGVTGSGNAGSGMTGSTGSGADAAEGLSRRREWADVGEADPLPEWWTDDSAQKHPWGTYSAATEELQVLTNMLLKDQGYCPIGEDGKLDAATCGAAGHVGLPMPSTCQKLTPPSKWLCGGTTKWIIGGLVVASGALVLGTWKKR